MSILRTILDRVENQVSEDWFRNQLIQELGSTNFNDDAADTNGFYPGQLYFFTYSAQTKQPYYCLLYTSPSPRDRQKSRMPSSA